MGGRLVREKFFKRMDRVGWEFLYKCISARSIPKPPELNVGWL
jgi:hypothetical protein